MSASAPREWLVRVALVGAALIHLLPLPGVLGVDVLQRLYGLDAIEPSVELLLRHRALMFGLLGAFLLAAWPVRAWRLPAAALVLAGDLAFLGLALAGWPATPALQRVAAFDAVSILLLLIVLADARRPAQRG